MAKDNKVDIDLKEEKPKKGFFKKMFAGKAEQKEVLKHMKTSGVKNFLFYTDVDNILLILEQGIRLIKDQKSNGTKEYTVWTYLENNNSIGMEFDSSTRAHFWKWATEAKIDVEKVAVIGIDPNKLAEVSKEDWAWDKTSNIVYVYDAISKDAISWIMIKDKKNLQRIQTVVESNDISIDVFLGEKGNINAIDKEGNK